MSQRTEIALGGRYRLDLRIATGGMGEVWRATDEVLGRPVAVKVLRREYADDPTFLERFRAEARNMAALTHPGVAAVHDFGETRLGDADVPYIVMELVPGEPLSTIIEQGGPLPVDRALDIVAQAAAALQAAHENGVVHRDVKPANLLVTPSGTVKVTDFGIARAADALQLTRSGTVMGTAHYLAPELATSRGAASPLSDVYALGTVLYECLAGTRPFPGDNPVTVALAHVQQEPPPLPSDVPVPVRELVGRAMAKDPLDRPADAGELARLCAALRVPAERAAPGTAFPVSEVGAPHGPMSGIGAPHGPAGGIGAAATPALGTALFPTPAPAGAGVAGVGVAGAGVTGAGVPGAGPSGADPTGAEPTSPGSTGRTPTGHGRRRASRRARKPASKPARRHGPGLLMALGALILALVAAGLLVGLRPGSAAVPEVTRLHEEQAKARLAALGFPIEIQREVNRSVPAGVVLRQRPVPGTEFSVESPVLLVVSAGPPRVRVDAADWRGRPYDEVATALRRRGLEVIRQVAAAPGTAGTVADITPVGLVPVGATVKVTVFETPPPAPGRAAQTTTGGDGDGATTDQSGAGTNSDERGKGEKRRGKGKGRKP